MAGKAPWAAMSGFLAFFTSLLFVILLLAVVAEWLLLRGQKHATDYAVAYMFGSAAKANAHYRALLESCVRPAAHHAVSYALTVASLLVLDFAERILIWITGMTENLGLSSGSSFSLAGFPNLVLAQLYYVVFSSVWYGARSDIGVFAPYGLRRRWSRLALVVLHALALCWAAAVLYISTGTAGSGCGTFAAAVIVPLHFPLRTLYLGFLAGLAPHIVPAIIRRIKHRAQGYIGSRKQSPSSEAGASEQPDANIVATVLQPGTASRIMLLAFNAVVGLYILQLGDSLSRDVHTASVSWGICGSSNTTTVTTADAATGTASDTLTACSLTASLDNSCAVPSESVRPVSVVPRLHGRFSEGPDRGDYVLMPLIVSSLLHLFLIIYSSRVLFRWWRALCIFTEAVTVFRHSCPGVSFAVDSQLWERLRRHAVTAMPAHVAHSQRALSRLMDVTEVCNAIKTLGTGLWRTLRSEQADESDDGDGAMADGDDSDTVPLLRELVGSDTDPGSGSGDTLDGAGAGAGAGARPRAVVPPVPGEEAATPAVQRDKHRPQHVLLDAVQLIATLYQANNTISGVYTMLIELLSSRSITPVFGTVLNDVYLDRELPRADTHLQGVEVRLLEYRDRHILNGIPLPKVMWKRIPLVSAQLSDIHLIPNTESLNPPGSHGQPVPFAVGLRCYSFALRSLLKRLEAKHSALRSWKLSGHWRQLLLAASDRREAELKQTGGSAYDADAAAGEDIQVTDAEIAAHQDAHVPHEDVYDLLYSIKESMRQLQACDEVHVGQHGGRVRTSLSGAAGSSIPTVTDTDDDSVADEAEWDELESIQEETAALPESAQSRYTGELHVLSQLRDGLSSLFTSQGAAAASSGWSSIWQAADVYTDVVDWFKQLSDNLGRDTANSNFRMLNATSRVVESLFGSLSSNTRVNRNSLGAHNGAHYEVELVLRRRRSGADGVSLEPDTVSLRIPLLVLTGGEVTGPLADEAMFGQAWQYVLAAAETWRMRYVKDAVQAATEELTHSMLARVQRESVRESLPRAVQFRMATLLDSILSAEGTFWRLQDHFLWLLSAEQYQARLPMQVDQAAANVEAGGSTASTALVGRLAGALTQTMLARHLQKHRLSTLCAVEWLLMRTGFVRRPACPPPDGWWWQSSAAELYELAAQPPWPPVDAMDISDMKRADWAPILYARSTAVVAAWVCTWVANSGKV